jgi:hypothetical protein
MKFGLRWVAVVSLIVAVVGLVSPTSALASSYDPGPVGNVAVTSGPGTLTVSWSPPSNPGLGLYSTGCGLASIRWYEVSTTSYGSGSPGCTYVTGTSCTLTGLTNGQSYTLYIEACNSNNTGSYCLWSSTVTAGPFTPCCSVPSAPPTVVAAAGDAIASVSWDAPRDNPAAIGTISRYVVTPSPAAPVCETAERTCQFSGLQNGVSYTFTVVAVNSAGTSRASVASNTVMPAGLPSSPQNVSALLSKGTAVVTWVGPASTGGVPITQYVAQATPGGFACTSDGAVSCVITGLSNGQTYTFTVTATNRVGSSAPSAPSPQAKLLAGPGAPLRVKAARAGTTVQVSWQPPRSTGGTKIKKYVVSASPGGRSCSTAKLTCSISKLAVGNSYTFTVQPFNAKGPGVPVESNRITIPVPPPPPKQTQEIS